MLSEDVLWYIVQWEHHKWISPHQSVSGSKTRYMTADSYCCPENHKRQKKHWFNQAVKKCVSVSLCACLTLLLTSLSLGRISSEKPSACPLVRFPPFMKFPKAKTKPRTCSTPEPLWRVWTEKTKNQVQGQNWRESSDLIQRASELPDWFTLMVPVLDSH